MSHPSMHIVPVFITHAGCPHRCVFCDQSGITGNVVPPSTDDVRNLLLKHLSSRTKNAVIAFYGGSFTCIDRELQEAYLGVAGGFVKDGMAAYIRLSTRPDCIDAETAQFLLARGVRVVELGAQSMDDGVLAASARGHRAHDTERAASLIKSAGMELGMQVMAGLPGDSDEGFMRTVRAVAGLRPGFVRVYPALVLKGAPLEKLYQRGEYMPLSLEDAVRLCADACVYFEQKGIKVVRTGLQPSESLESSLVAGPYHPAFGHMVGSEIALRRMVSMVGSEYGENAPDGIGFAVNPSELSRYLGINKDNLDRLKMLYGQAVYIKPDDNVDKGGLRLCPLV
jgi:histone acetyltransferase (RNA polymerase elongator complex component)